MNSFDLMIERYKKEMQELNKSFNSSEKQSNFENERENNNSQLIEKKQQPVVQVLADVNERADDGISYGELVIQAFMSSEVYPIVSANVIISDGNNKNLYDLYTDVNGKTQSVSLAAPSAKLSQQPTNVLPYSQYNVEVSHPKYKTRKYIGVPVFAGVESVQPVQLIPILSASTADDVIVTIPYDLGRTD